ncbi:GMC family oxidoreductase [Actinomadura sp. DC4]|uniref:GMC family oxidoreductase N-terminal domain-containing protein n=1 Tax=Actinomadura sp. DC4 TaxID=3055069 RepID=UPI0025AEFF08|nr:GMC family oxidoreductase [Actinomadura sp. DC4]MDN3357163.1 GMC family oxidoreductase [Actinomadura sp. DC4]
MDYDVIVVGSGFGGSVTALRLTEKGYRVAVVEAGRRFDEPDGEPGERHRDLPKTSWRTRKYLWAPGLGMTGIQRMHLLRGEKGSRVLVLAGAGVGGGSLVYANTLYEPPAPFFDDPQWRHITDWKAELAPFYDQARRMLGVRTNPTMTPADEAIKRVAERMGREETFHRTPVGVLFGSRPGERVEDPYFGGAGPRRTTCTECGSCMTGCRAGAKNMLTENYLYLAEHAGAEVLPMTTVTAVRPRAEGGYAVEVRRTGRAVRRLRRTLTADQVVFAGGTYGTQRLLHRMKTTGALPGLSDRLGVRTRTNSEAILGVERLGRKGDDHSRGVAITSSFHPDDHTHIEPTRYGPGSNAMGAMRSLMIDGGGRTPRWAKFLGEAVRRPHDLVRLPNLRDWSRRTIVALVMQTRDNSITVVPSSSGRGMRARPGHGEPIPTWIPMAHRVVRMLAEEMGGMAGGTWLDLFNIPTTAHFIGGCTIGSSPSEGVIDPYHRVYGHPGLHVVDGSSVSANLGVNPSLTITAQAERAMAFWPNLGEEDPRPALGTGYARLSPVSPKSPAVPADAPAALRLPISPV